MLIPSLNISVEAEPKNGKTTFLYTAPLPIVGMQWDPGLEGLYGEYAWSSKMFEGVEIIPIAYDPGKLEEYLDRIAKIEPNMILAFNLPAPLQTDASNLFGCRELYSYHTRLLSKAQRTPIVSSIVEDTMTLARKVFADAHLESEQQARLRQIEAQRARNTPEALLSAPRAGQLSQLEWGKPHGWVEDVYNSTKGAGKNLIASHRLTEEFQDRPNRDGNLVPTSVGFRLEGYKKTYSFVDVGLSFSRDRVLMPTRGADGKVEDVYTPIIKGTFRWCRTNLMMEDQVVQNPTWNLITNAISLSVNGRLTFPQRKAI